MDKLLTKNNLIHAVSGATGSAFSLTVFYPLDALRTRLQVDDNLKDLYSWQAFKNIVKKEGFGALYKGLLAVATSLCVSNFIYFYVFNSLKINFPADVYVTIRDIVIGLIAGSVTVLLTTPMWVVNTRLKLQGVKLNDKKDDGDMRAQQTYSGFFDCMLKVLQNEGIAALWSGTWASLVLALSPALNFTVYEFLKRYLQLFTASKDLHGILYFMMGGTSKFVSTMLTYPLQVVQSRDRAGSSNKDAKRSSGIFNSLVSIARLQGPLGLYRGLTAKLLQTILTTALMFVTYEEIVKFITFVIDKSG